MNSTDRSREMRTGAGGGGAKAADILSVSTKELMAAISRRFIPEGVGKVTDTIRHPSESRPFLSLSLRGILITNPKASLLLLSPIAIEYYRFKIAIFAMKWLYHCRNIEKTWRLKLRDVLAAYSHS